MRSESEVMQLIQLEAPKYGVILWRNNSGMLPNKNGTPVRYGLGHTSPKQQFASSDLIGIKFHHGDGMFVAVEVKKEGWIYKGSERETKQKNFINYVLQTGGYAGFAQSVEDFKKIIGVI